ncbi:unnamed protein product [Ostreobium quekettii]|uniref:PET hydrolase/cutinase-like domain-containing protein n=1 Tax=Ostreobium quekettii TaxID=121088 RepID=A0A8S1J9V0_9CHLO|nr:unnamed protein product [Ostreobium quekettii]
MGRTGMRPRPGPPRAETQRHGLSRPWMLAIVTGFVAIAYAYQGFFLPGDDDAADGAISEDFDFDGVAPADPNISFAKSNEHLRALIDDRPYGHVLNVILGEKCGHYFRKFLKPICYNWRAALTSFGVSGPRCCEAVRSFIDEGKCLCIPRVVSDVRSSGLSWALQIARICEVQIPLFWDVRKTLELDVCKPIVENSPRGQLNADFLAMRDGGGAPTGSIDPSNIPSFDEVFQPPKPGPFQTALAHVVVKRPMPSILKNTKSSATHFGADVFYPVDPGDAGTSAKKVRGQRVVAAGGPFPLVAFSPGYSGVPGNFKRTLSHLASQGVVVISQYSTSHLRVDINRKKMEAWTKDMVYMLKYLIEQGNHTESFLSNGVDARRTGIAGHSFGAGMAIAAAALARNEYGLNVTALMPISAACLIMGNSCEMPSTAAPKLHGINALFLVGTMDEITPPKASEWFHSQMPNDTSSKVVYLQGATHCMFEAEPKMWPNMNSGCGRGTMSPQESVRRMQIEMAKFFGQHLQTSS